MKLAAVQMMVSADKRENLRRAAGLAAQAVSQGAECVVFPEMFCCPYTNKSFSENAEPEDGIVCRTMAELAAEHRILLIAGSMPELSGGRIYNTSFVFDAEGRRIARHRKVHLFDIDVKGGQRFFESETFTRGSQCTVFDTAFGRLGLCICFDMRFPELSMNMALRGAQAVIAPAAFNMTTGPAHWETMFRQRAVDNQLFTVGCAPARDTGGEYVSYGNSIICGPWGNVLARAGAEETILLSDLDFAENERIRAQLPLLSARIPEVYMREIPGQD